MCYTTKHGPSIKSNTRNNKKRTRFVLKIENFPSRQETVKSNVIKVEVGEEEASQWILELTPGLENQPRALSASLWRTDDLSTDLEVTMTLIASYSSLTSRGPAVTASSIVTQLTDSEEARLGIHVTSILTQTVEKVADSDCTLTVECQLSVRNLSETPAIPRQYSLPQLDPTISLVYSLPHSLDDLEDSDESEDWSWRKEKRLMFGSVEELHYLVRKPRERMWGRLTRSLGRLLDGIEAGDNSDPYLLLQVLTRQ